MPHWIIVHRDAEGDIQRVDGLWEADTAEAAIAAVLAKTGREDNGRWQAEAADKRADIMNWHLEQDSKGRPKPPKG